MNFKLIYIILTCVLFFSCDQSINKKSKLTNIHVQNMYKNIGFALVYDDSLENIKKLDSRSLSIYHKSLKKKSSVKITNPKNGNYLIATVLSNKIKFSNFYNSILSSRIA